MRGQPMTCQASAAWQEGISFSKRSTHRDVLLLLLLNGWRQSVGWPPDETCNLTWTVNQGIYQVRNGKSKQPMVFLAWEV